MVEKKAPDWDLNKKAGRVALVPAKPPKSGGHVVPVSVKIVALPPLRFPNLTAAAAFLYHPMVRTTVGQQCAADRVALSPSRCW